MPVPRDDDALDEEQEEELFLDEEQEFPEEELELEEELEPTEEGGARRGPSPARAVDVFEEDFRAKLATVDASTATPYVMRGDYAAGELVLHPQFGVGIVAAIVGPKKMQVIFQESSKLLVMNYAPSR